MFRQIELQIFRIVIFVNFFILSSFKWIIIMWKNRTDLPTAKLIFYKIIFLRPKVTFFNY